MRRSGYLSLVEGNPNEPFNDQCSHHIEPSQLICSENQLTLFCMMGTLVVNKLKKKIKS